MASTSGSNGSGGGNTKLPRKSRVSPSKKWCFTWNNYPMNWDTLLVPKFEGSEWIVGEEIGENGTPHLQGYIEFSTKVRAIQHIGIPQIHWEKAKGSRLANAKYCSKDGKFQGTIKVPKPIRVISALREWQQELADCVAAEPDDRAIHWTWSRAGGTGKSAFVKWLCVKHGALICGGSAKDMKYLIVKYIEKHDVPPEIVIMDIPRQMEEYISYAALEEIKNGCFASTKYECDTVVMNPPHVLCFANFEPKYEALSEDRWRVKCIDSS